MTTLVAIGWPLGIVLAYRVRLSPPLRHISWAERTLPHDRGER